MGESFTSYLRDLFAELGPVSLRKMFGGQGLYHDGLIIGLGQAAGCPTIETSLK